MDFFLSDIFLKYEIFGLCISVGYLFFRFLVQLFMFVVRVRFVMRKPVITPLTAVADAQKQETVAKKEEEEILENASAELSAEEKQKVSDCVASAKVRIAAGDYSDARAIVIEWLSLDKFHKELNILLASLYEIDKDYKKAELIYKDLILMHDSDPEIYLKLGFSLSMQKKFEIGFEIYKKLLSLNPENTEAMEMCANLAFELQYFADAREYAKKFLHRFPRNPDMLYLLAVSSSKLENRLEAEEALQKLHDMDPYNENIKDLLDKIRTEMEMEKNFEKKE